MNLCHSQTDMFPTPVAGLGKSWGRAQIIRVLKGQRTQIDTEAAVILRELKKGDRGGT